MIAPASPIERKEPLTLASPKPPKQCKLLGATVKGIGLITTVGVQSTWRWGLIEDANGFEHHVFLSDLKREQLTMPASPMPYRETKRRIGYGLFEDCYELELLEYSDLTHVDGLDAAA